MKIKFCGAARTVTGSCHLLTLSNGYKILLDCGLYQGVEADLKDFNREWLFDPADIDVLILSHAHIDHSGRIPKLVKDGFQGKIICTNATYDLSAIMLQDSAFIQEKDATWDNKRMGLSGKDMIQPLYKVSDVIECLNQFESINYEEWFEISPQVKLLFRDSGHILGSASITLEITEENRPPFYFGFSGDIGRPDRMILKDPAPMPQLDYLICESTYGGRFHEDMPRETERFLKILTETCVKNKGKLIIPAFSVGRTQEIVYMLDKLESSGRLPKIQVFVDSPLAVNATEIFRAHPECFDDEISMYMMTDPNPFGFNNLFYLREAEDSKKLNTMEGPAIIISASGMMEGGRIRHHIYNHIEDTRNTILFVGFAPEHTLAGRIRNGADKIHLFGEEKMVKAGIEIMDSFSAHGDQDEMLTYLSNQQTARLKHIFLVHGDYERQMEFREALSNKGYRKISIPLMEQEYKV